MFHFNDLEKRFLKSVTVSIFLYMKRYNYEKHTNYMQ